MSYYPNLFFPTKILIVDDDKDFSSRVSSMLLDEPLVANTRICNNPSEASKILENDHLENIIYKNIFLEKEEEVQENYSIDINIKQISNLINDHDKYDHYSVLITDYEMPSMSGIDVCRSIKNSNVQKILITGAADEMMAVSAFNEGVIHKFISKKSSNFRDMLTREVRSSIKTFFEKELSGLSILSNVRNNRTALGDKKFKEFLRTFFIENKVVECYPFNLFGSFYIKNENNETFLLATLTDDDIEIILESEQARKCSEEIVQEINSRKKLLFYYDIDGYKIPNVELWGEYLYPVHFVKGEMNNFYVALIKKNFLLPR